VFERKNKMVMLIIRALFRKDFWEAIGYIVGLHLLWILFSYVNPYIPSIEFWKNRLRKIVKGDL